MSAITQLVAALSSAVTEQHKVDRTAEEGRRNLREAQDNAGLGRFRLQTNLSEVRAALADEAAQRRAKLEQAQEQQPENIVPQAVPIDTPGGPQPSLGSAGENLQRLISGGGGLKRGEVGGEAETPTTGGPTLPGLPSEAERTIQPQRSGNTLGDVILDKFFGPPPAQVQPIPIAQQRAAFEAVVDDESKAIAATLEQQQNKKVPPSTLPNQIAAMQERLPPGAVRASVAAGVALFREQQAKTERQQEQSKFVSDLIAGRQKAAEGRRGDTGVLARRAKEKEAEIQLKVLNKGEASLTQQERGFIRFRASLSPLQRLTDILLFGGEGAGGVGGIPGALGNPRPATETDVQQAGEAFRAANGRDPTDVELRAIMSSQGFEF